MGGRRVPATPPADSVLRGGEEPYLFTVSPGIEIYRAAHDRNRPFLPLIGVYQPGARMREWSQHDADEFLYVLSGSANVETPDETLTVHEGDSMFISGGRQHRIGAEGSDGCKILVITTEGPGNGSTTAT